MPLTELKPKSGSDIDHRKAILSLRWLLVILASYLTLFSYLGTELVLFSLLVVSLLFGVFNYFRLFGFQFDTDIERFLTLALFFVVAIFYVFLSERLSQDAIISRTMTEENRIAEVMVEMTRALSSSLNTDDVLYSIVSRLHQVLEAEECSIVRVDSKTGSAKVVVKLPNLEQGDVALDIDLYPELNQAYISRQFVFLPYAKPTAFMSVPIIVP